MILVLLEHQKSTYVLLLLYIIFCCSCYDVSDIKPILDKYHSLNVGFKLYDLYQFDESILLNTVPQVCILHVFIQTK